MKAVVNLKDPYSRFHATYQISLMGISYSHLKQCRNSLLISQLACFGVFCKFWGDFWVYLGGDFHKGVVKFGEIRSSLRIFVTRYQGYTFRKEK